MNENGNINEKFLNIIENLKKKVKENKTTNDNSVE